jgi:MarR family transcriptional regulator, organic hydroperoxide resistance regulator
MFPPAHRRNPWNSNFYRYNNRQKSLPGKAATDTAPRRRIAPERFKAGRAGSNNMEVRMTRATEARPLPEPQGDLAGLDPMFDSSIGYVLRDTYRGFSRVLQSKIAPHGVSIGQWYFLRVLWEEDGLTQRELSQRVGMMEPTTVTALNGMEKRGYVKRVRNVKDRRKINIFLTDKGRALKARLLPFVPEINRVACKNINEAELETLRTLLAAMKKNLDHIVP